MSGFAKMWRVVCSVSWCRRVSYMPASLPVATERMLEHWRRDHARRLLHSRGRGAGGFIYREDER